MARPWIYRLIVVFAGLLWMLGTDAAPKQSALPASDEPPAVPAVQRGNLRLIQLPAAVEPNLPDAPGRQTAQLMCGTCHTAAYITLQPPLSRATWLAEVTKMRTTYAGPIPEDKVDEIVQYLVAVRGMPSK